IGTVPILIVVDCKHHGNKKNLVDRRDIAAFAEQMEDVAANAGVMVTDSGYDGGASKLAASKNIILKTYREAVESDWEAVVGRGAWFNFNHIDHKLERVRVILIDGRKLDRVPPELPLYRANGNPYKEGDATYLFSNLFMDVWADTPRPRQIGRDIYLEFDQLSPELFVPLPDGQIRPAEVVILEGGIVPKRYAANLRMLAGNALHDLGSGTAEYIEASTEPFDIRALVQSHVGVECTNEQWERDERQATKPRVTLPKDALMKLRLCATRSYKKPHAPS
ncbi:MAG TPA: restriction endonuclease, partial [Blastocatellia bacterium]